MARDERPTVWSTEKGDLRKKPSTGKRNRIKSLDPSGQVIYLHRESKGRGGKPVSLVKNLKLTDEDLKSLAKTLKRACSSGGTVKDGVILIQGEHRKKIKGVLENLGYRVKISGG
jgi:translation initiation factor 1